MGLNWSVAFSHSIRILFDVDLVFNAAVKPFSVASFRRSGTNYKGSLLVINDAVIDFNAECLFQTVYFYIPEAENNRWTV